MAEQEAAQVDEAPETSGGDVEAAGDGMADAVDDRAAELTGSAGAAATELDRRRQPRPGRPSRGAPRGDRPRRGSRHAEEDSGADVGLPGGSGTRAAPLGGCAPGPALGSGSSSAAAGAGAPQRRSRTRSPGLSSSGFRRLFSAISVSIGLPVAAAIDPNDCPLRTVQNFGPERLARRRRHVLAQLDPLTRPDRRRVRARVERLELIDAQPGLLGDVRVRLAVLDGPVRRELGDRRLRPSVSGDSVPLSVETTIPPTARTATMNATGTMYHSSQPLNNGPVPSGAAMVGSPLACPMPPRRARRRSAWRAAANDTPAAAACKRSSAAGGRRRLS